MKDFDPTNNEHKDLLFRERQKRGFVLVLKRASKAVIELIKLEDLQTGDIFRVLHQHDYRIAVEDPYLVDGEWMVSSRGIDLKSLTSDKPDGKYTLALSSDEAEFLRKIAQ